MELITLKTFERPIDANILKSKLESEGIECFLFDENIVGMNPLFSVMVGGVKLKVKEDDLEVAKNILSEIESTPITDENDNSIRCPKCNSDEISTGYQSIKSIAGVLSFIVAVLLRIFPFHTKNVYKCKKCGNEFERK